MVEGFRREDPPSIPQLAIPIKVPNMCFEAAFTPSANASIQAGGCLILIAFYFLLRVGEYTQPRYIYRNGERIRASRTKQFSVGNVAFFKDGTIVPRNSPLQVLLNCDSATLKITNQKNGRMGDTIHQKAIQKNSCPIRALAHRVHHILSNGGSESTLLCAYKHNNEWSSVTSSEIIKMIRAVARELKLEKQAIDPDLIGAHSLRSGGAMALKLHGFNDTTIMKMGRWSSLTFLQYIHTQIAHLSEDISRKMSIPLPFLNIAAIENDGSEP
jgi:hypothetical protein